MGIEFCHIKSFSIYSDTAATNRDEYRVLPVFVLFDTIIEKYIKDLFFPTLKFSKDSN
jgi:hypothetical protein